MTDACLIQPSLIAGPQVRSATVARVRMGSLGGARSSAPDIVRPSDVRLIMEDLRQRQSNLRADSR